MKQLGRAEIGRVMQENKKQPTKASYLNQRMIFLTRLISLLLTIGL